MKTLIVSLYAVSALLVSSAATAQTNARGWANGEWGIDPKYADDDENIEYRCGKNTLKVSVSGTGYSSWWEDATKRETGQVFGGNDTHFKLKFDGEKRLMDNGETHVWLMVFIDEDHFTWVREDWLAADGELQNNATVWHRCTKLEIG